MNHSQLVCLLTKKGKDIQKNMTPNEAHLIHMVMGISGEAGELLDAVKKHCIYKKPLDINNVIEELGDLEFFMEGMRTALGLTREETLQANMDKLLVRYSEGTYSDTAAQVRADKAEN